VFDHWVERARRVVGSPKLPGWEDATRFTRSGLFLTPDEAAHVGDEIHQIIDRYRGRERDPSQRPAGSLPVEFVSYLSPVPEWAPVAGPSRDIS
jgi:hypothetical protein